jgi:glutathione S-transferase
LEKVSASAGTKKPPTAAYVDVARERGTDEMLSILGDAGQQHIPFAPPFLRHGKRLIGQTAVILQYLAHRHALAPKAETHHPISAELYYKDQKREAALRAKHFRESRVPKFLA